MGPANDRDDRRELVTLNLDIGEAEQRADADFLRSVLAEDLYFRRAGGSVVDRSTYLEELTQPGNATEELVSEGLEVSVYEGVAVASLRVRVRGTRGGQPADGTYRNVRLFVRRPEGWKLRVWFNTPAE